MKKMTLASIIVGFFLKGRIDARLKRASRNQAPAMHGSKYVPHQGKREIERNRKRLEKLNKAETCEEFNRAMK